MGVDDVLGGYNPHNIADASQVTSALSQLLLPSVFRPKDDGTVELDKNLMKSAEIVSQQPFTVAYTIRPDASWSDSAPIAAEDFAYLREAMRDQPGVIGAAGYRLISDIQSREGGKRVEVTFSKPYPGWQTLFNDLLPAHLLKDAPNGWQGALASTFPAVAGPYSIKGLDTARGEVTLERNERYWEKPSALDRIVLRAADQDGTLAALRSGNDQFAMTRTDGAYLKRLAELGSAVQLHTVARPTVAEILLRPVSSTLSDPKVREGVAALIDRAKLITEAAAGGPSDKLRADAQVRVPSSKSGYQATIPNPGPPSATDPVKGEELLKSAGYTKEAGTWRKNGKNLSLVVASPAKQEPYATIAKELTAQLVAAGIEVNAIAPQPRELFSNLLAMPVLNGVQQTSPEGAGNVGIDIAVIGQSAGSADVASVLASTFGCRPDQLVDKARAVVPGNPLGFCDPALQPSIDAALAGTTPIADALKTLEPELWRRNVAIPLFQLADTLAIGSGISGVTAGPPMVGPFGSAVNWTRGPK